VQGLFSDRVKRYPTASYGTVFNDPADGERDTRAYLDAGVHHSFDSKTELDLRVYYDAYNYKGSGDYLEPEIVRRIWKGTRGLDGS